MVSKICLSPPVQHHNMCAWPSSKRGTSHLLWGLCMAVMCGDTITDSTNYYFMIYWTLQSTGVCVCFRIFSSQLPASLSWRRLFLSLQTIKKSSNGPVCLSEHVNQKAPLNGETPWYPVSPAICGPTQLLVVDFQNKFGLFPSAQENMSD